MFSDIHPQSMSFLTSQGISFLETVLNMEQPVTGSGWRPIVYPEAKAAAVMR